MEKTKRQNGGLIVFFPGGEIGWCQGKSALVSLIKEKISKDNKWLGQQNNNNSLHIVKFSTVLQLPLEGKKHILNPQVTTLSSLIECQVTSAGREPLISLRKKESDGKEPRPRKKV